MEVYTHDDFAIQLTAEVIHKIREQTFTCLPEEACGVLLGTVSKKSLLLDDYIPVRNTAANPQHHFALDPVHWTSLLFNERRICGLFHSHPASPPVPSQADFNQLQSFGGLLKVYFIGSPQLSQPGDLLLYAYRIRKEFSPPHRTSHPSQDQESKVWTLRQEDFTILHST